MLKSAKFENYAFEFKVGIPFQSILEKLNDRIVSALFLKI